MHTNTVYSHKAQSKRSDCVWLHKNTQPFGRVSVAEDTEAFVIVIVLDADADVDADADDGADADAVVKVATSCLSLPLLLFPFSVFCRCCCCRSIVMEYKDCISSLAIMKTPFASAPEDFSLIKYCSRDLVAVIVEIVTVSVLISLLIVVVVVALECTVTVVVKGMKYLFRDTTLILRSFNIYATVISERVKKINSTSQRNPITRYNALRLTN
uniref:Uncharacterized protein n=1 Tax=Glossina pallidipes TaxID=7398 RepID=A0A1A9Z6B5_GLOPL